ncbi:MAG TPA: S8 family serine peptidase [Bryobacteraceae bacterium]|nr:S8 family serine peptidase [Bryobacteraceae bacterium]
MKRSAIFFTFALWTWAQPIPNRYIVEFTTEPAVAVATAKGQRFAAADSAVQARRLQIQSEHAAAEQTVQSLGGTVTHHFNTVLNGMAVTMTPDAAAQLRQMPGVKSVHQVSRQKAVLDHAVNVHRISQAWQGLANGTGGAGAGTKIAIFDTGIDLTHPGFKGFATAMPMGFPIGTNSAELVNTNNKVIVSRFYSDAGSGITNTTAVPCTAVDATSDCGHGTGTAMIAAGVSNDPQVSGVTPLIGVASGAWLGNYKLADDTGASSDVTLIAALEDAVTDGMDAINYSFGGPIINASDENGPAATAIQNVLNAGVVFVTAAGNDGVPGSGATGSIGTPAAAAAAIGVGGNENERFFFFGATVGTLPAVVAVLPPAEQGVFTGQVTGTMVDVATLDHNGFGCSAFAANSLANNIALIQRGPIGAACTFDTKVANAQNAGAAGVIVYDHTDEPLVDYTLDIGFDPALFSPGLTAATLPMLFVGLKDGQTLKAAVAANPAVKGSIDMDGITPLPRPSNVIVDFSSAGPTPAANVKPDLAAVGDAMLTADATANNPGFPYIYAGGTSFSTPLVAGSIALVKAARPGLTGAQYKSLIVNSASEFDQYTDGSVAPPQSAGAGILNAMNALQNNLVASPTSINFAARTTSVTTSGSSMMPTDGTAAQGSASQTVTLTNVGSGSDSFSVSIQTLGNGPAPTVDTTSFSLGAGMSQVVNVALNTGSLAPGQYHGFLLITGSQTSVVTRIPYWFGVSGNAVQQIELLLFPQVSSTGFAETIYFRAADVAGVPFEPAGNPTVTTTNARARVVDVQAVGDIPGTFATDIVVGRPDANGVNTFTITVDGTNINFIVFVQ